MCFKAIDEFIRRQNWSNSDAKRWNTAVKFLMARRFDVERAIKLYEDHEVTRKCLNSFFKSSVVLLFFIRCCFLESKEKRVALFN